jgi:UDP-3-O-[3-hydroxymyristoyl] glucosamine N-acyltransferase
MRSKTTGAIKVNEMKFVPGKTVDATERACSCSANTLSLTHLRSSYLPTPKERYAASRSARAGAVIYAGVQVGIGTVIGHHTLLRSFVTVGEETQLGHNLTVERGARIGDCVRCSPVKVLDMIPRPVVVAVCLS